jgi:tRNA threonylcarbamoyl adenosine modification protein YeaZ
LSDPKGPILGIDGALSGFSAALVSNDGRELSRAAASASEALERGLEAIAQALGPRELGDLSAVAVCTGPGSYTGLRVALSYATAIATAAALPLGPGSSSHLLEGAEQREPRIAVISPRTGLGCARYSGPAGRATLCAPLEELAAWVLAFGDREIVSCGVSAGDGLGLAERGLRVHSSTLAGPAALHTAQLALGRAPERSPHAAVADYGFPAAPA